MTEIADWFDHRAPSAIADALAATDPDGNGANGDATGALEIIIEGLFRSEVPFAYSGWPPESTTDGTAIYVCRRVAAGEIEVTGLTDIDFTGQVFPFQATLRSDPLPAVDLAIGDAESDTGAPPRLPAGSVIIPVRNAEDRIVDVRLIAGRTETPIEWTPVLKNWPPRR